jgi:PAS domain S-box-containing protein
MLKKFWPLNKKKKSSPDINANLYKELFQYLTKQITVPRNAEQLIQLGHQVNKKPIEEVFRTYLLFEKYICSFEPEQKFTLASLRKEVQQRFPILMISEPFSILFVSDTEKKNTIAIQFLSAFLESVLEQFGQAGAGYFERKKNQLSELDAQKRKEEVFRELQFLSFDIFQFISTNYGNNLAGKIFEKNFDHLSAKYKELEVFPHLITLIPKEIVRREHLDIFTQAQIEQVFLEKLAETERLNIALDQKIKELESMQKLLVKNEVMLSSVISSALDAIVMTDSSAKIIKWNPAARDMFGYTDEEVQGREVIGTIVSDEYLKSLNIQFERLLNNPNNPFFNKRLEVICQRKGGESFPAEVTITAFQINNEYFFSGFIRDISLRKQYEEELVKTKERAEQAAKAKSQFLSVMSHEIRTPLNAIIGFTELLSQNNPRQDQKEDLNMLKFSGENLLHIINDILDFNKLESGKVQVSNVSFNLRELTQSLYQSFSYRAKEKKIFFDVEYDERVPFVVKGDSLHLSQILNNLISNAIKFTNEGSVKLKIELEEVAPQEIRTKFSVIDTGIGIPAEKHETIFEQFIQADGDTTRLFGGTGLGLSISAKLATLMGSKIYISSEPGKGSTFYFNIVFQPSEELKANGSLQKSNRKGSTSFHGKKILLAEDNKFNANIARRYINSWGAELDVALDGQQALEFSLRKQYDLVLMDVQMPVLDGFACSQAIRVHLPEIPIVAITAAPINEVLEQIRSSGMNDYVSKPFKPNELFTKLEQYLVVEEFR